MEKQKTQVLLEELNWKLPTIDREIKLDWELPIWGYGDMITSPVVANGWTIAPVTMEDIPSIPNEAIEKVEQILNSGVIVKGIAIAHDKVEEEVTKPEPTKVSEPIDIPWETIGSVLGAIVVGVGMVFLYALGAAICGGDPVILCVIDFEDGTKPAYCEIFRWWED